MQNLVKISNPEINKKNNYFSNKNLVFTGTSQGVTMAVTDLKNTTSNQFEESWEHEGDKAFQFNYKIENLKMIPGNYDVDVSTTALVSHWHNQSMEIDYWIALEQPNE